MSEHLQSRVDEHERQIAAFRADMASFGRELAGIKDTQSLILGKFDAMNQSLATLQAHKPAPTLDVLRTVMSMAVSTTVLVSAIVAGIIYVSSNANNVILTSLQKDVQFLAEASSPADVAVMKHRIDEVEHALGEISKVAPWAPKVTPYHR